MKVSEYINGTYLVKHYSDGTKILEDPSEKFIAEFPDNLDVKITSFCNVGCSFCYEDSNTSGKHCNSDLLLSKLSKLPKGIEITLGGGDPLSHPEILKIIKGLAIDQEKLVSLTVNQTSIKKDLILNCINSGLRAIGISPKKDNYDFIDFDLGIPVVYHFILGIHPIEQIEKYLEKGKKVLILGYKSIGRGKNSTPPLDLWKSGIRRLKFKLTWNKEYPNAGISFDNLAIRQLNLQTSFTTYEWDRFYLGDDGSCSMYIDAVEGTYSESSTVSKISRTSWIDLEILDYFKHAKLLIK